MIQRVHPFPESAATPHWLFPDDTQLKAHPSYRKAKAGDMIAAKEVVCDLMLQFLMERRHRLPLNACYVAPHAREATGDNAIPQVLAAYSALCCDGQIDTDIVQIDQVFHTGADPMERLATRPSFEGLITAGHEYILVDDVTTMGAHLQNSITTL